MSFHRFIVDSALKYGDASVCASFNEPVIHLDYILGVFKLVKKYRLYTTIITNGSYTRETAEALIESGLDAANVDLKGCIETYRRFIGVKDLSELFENNVST